MHLDEDQLQRLLHGELPQQAEKSARDHVGRCPDCSRRLADAERDESEVHALLRVLDDPPPPVQAEAVAAKAEAVTGNARRRDLAWLRRAAAVLLAVGIAGAAYAVPGSPVRRWVHSVVQKMSGRPGPAGVPSAPGHAEKDMSGIAVVPGQNLLILFTSPQAGGQILVSLIDGAEVQVRAPADAATFTSSADQLLIANRSSSATFEIRIPGAAPRVEIRVGSDRVFLKQGALVTTSGSTNAGGSYLLRLKPSRP